MATGEGGPDPKPWCQAPRAALFFDVDGSVRSCCTLRDRIGWTTGPDRTSLPEMWRGHRVQQLREAVDRGDLTKGCEECASLAAGPGRSASLAAEFDRWATSSGEVPVDLEFALSNTCNLQCVMCNGDLSSSIRSQREGRPPAPQAYDDRFFDELDPWLATAERIAFKGGEPFLALESRRIMDRLVELGSTAEIKVTTNGTVWSERVDEYVRRLRIGLIISIDAMDRELLEQIRVGVVASELWANIDRFQAAAAEGRTITLSYCLMPQNWHELAPLLAEADCRGVIAVVNYVNQPRTHTLLHLDPVELGDISTAMRAQGADLRLRDPQLVQVWEQAVEWVRCCAEDPGFVAAGLQLLEPESTTVDEGQPTPVVVSARPGADINAQAVIAELAAWSGTNPVVLRCRDGVVTDAELPGWAHRWADLGLAGRSYADLPDQFSAVAGRPVHPEVDQGANGVTMVELLSEGDIWGRAVVWSEGLDVVVQLFVGSTTRMR